MMMTMKMGEDDDEDDDDDAGKCTREGVGTLVYDSWLGCTRLLTLGMRAHATAAEPGAGESEQFFEGGNCADAWSSVLATLVL